MSAPAALRPARPRRGEQSAVPDGRYEPEPLVQAGVDGTRVMFFGEDGRSAVFDFSRYPCPGLHRELAEAFAARTGETGGLRTRASAVALRSNIRLFLRFLGGLPHPPAALGELRTEHLQGYRRERQLRNASERAALRAASDIACLLCFVPTGLLDPDLAHFARQKGHSAGQGRAEGQPGYSDREFAQIMKAARSDVAAIRDRLRAGEALARSAEAGQLAPADAVRGSWLTEMAQTGKIPPLMARGGQHQQLAAARSLFLTSQDLTPLLILGVCLTGRNVETIKELPAEHRLLQDYAVALTIIKRRRGKTNSRETVHWETGRARSRELHTPGGFYLLAAELTERSRSFSGSPLVWSVFSAPRGASTARHSNPFGQSLTHGAINLQRWASGHSLHGDDGQPLRVTMNRLKTSVEVRVTRAVGGHLPSASRTNTMDVSFLHYLRSDPVIREWADQVLKDALDDAENSARSFRVRILSARTRPDPAAGAGALGITAWQLQQADSGELDTLASSCLDIDRHPATGQPCRASFISCLDCPNALVTERHLPMLLALADQLERWLQQMGADEWRRRHGRAWLIITRVILPRFTPAQIRDAEAVKPASLPIDLLGPPREPL
jgi:hypothetical protein